MDESAIVVVTVSVTAGWRAVGIAAAVAKEEVNTGLSEMDKGCKASRLTVGKSASRQASKQVGSYIRSKLQQQNNS